MYELRIRQVPILVKVVENHYPGNVPTTDLALLTASQKPATRCSSELIRCLTGTLVAFSRRRGSGWLVAS